MVSTPPMTPTLKTPPRPEFAALMSRLGFDDLRAAAYLGVPVYTLRKWVSGERRPNAAVLRLIDVLGTIEIMAPALHDSLVPPPSEPVKRGRPPKIKEAA